MIVSATEHTSRPPFGGNASSQLSATQIEAKVAHELSNLLNVVAACSDRLTSSPEVTAAARLDLLSLAGRVAHSIIDARRRGVSLRKWVPVNPTLRSLEAAVQLLLPSGVSVALELDPRAGTVHLAPGELDLVILNLVLDARTRLAGLGQLTIRSTHALMPAGEVVTVSIEDQPSEARAQRSVNGIQFGLATVRLITRDAAGEVELRPGRIGGFEVRISLPARPESSGS